MVNPNPALETTSHCPYIKSQGLTLKRPTKNLDIPKLSNDIIDYTIIRSCRRSNNRHIFRKQFNDTTQASIIRPKIMSPVGDAMRLINHKKAKSPQIRNKNPLLKLFISQTLRRYKETIQSICVKIAKGLSLRFMI